MPLVIKAQKARLDSALADLGTRFKQKPGTSVLDFFALVVDNSAAFTKDSPLHEALVLGTPLPKPFDKFTGIVTADVLIDFYEALAKAVSSSPVSRKTTVKWVDLDREREALKKKVVPEGKDKEKAQKAKDAAIQKVTADMLAMAWGFFSDCGETVQNMAGAIGGAMLPGPLWRKLREPTKFTGADEKFLADQGTVLAGKLDAKSLKDALAAKSFPPETTNALMVVFHIGGAHHFTLVQADKKWTLYQSNHFKYLITQPLFGRKDIPDLGKFLTEIVAAGGKTKQFMQEMSTGLIEYVLIH